MPDASNGWGYPYDSLLLDLARWRTHPDVRIDSIGVSVQGRALWMVTVTDASDSLASVAGRDGPKKRVVVHARTHPAEVQAQFVANGMLATLLDSGEVARGLRRDFEFHIVPQYNPDGVMLGWDRFNADSVDLEGNWNAPKAEPEVAALRKTFLGFMDGAIPVQVALNLHSDQFNCTRFFFFHQVGGTSEAYTELEKAYIAKVRSEFPDGIEDWNFVASWEASTPTRYPESFWWTNYREKVLALTYEDANCPDAGSFDRTGRALVLGTASYLRQSPDTATPPVEPQLPIPVRRILVLRAGVRLAGMAPGASWRLVDLRGRILATGRTSVADAILRWDELPSSSAALLQVRPAEGGVLASLLPRR